MTRHTPIPPEIRPQTSGPLAAAPARLMLAGVALTVGFDLSRAATLLNCDATERLLRAGVEIRYSLPMAGWWYGGVFFLGAQLPLPGLGHVEVHEGAISQADLVIGRDLHTALMAAAFAPRPAPNPPPQEVAGMDIHPPVGADGLPIARIDGEARIRDLDLAARLGFADPHKIRTLIERHKAALEALGISATVAEIPKGRGRPGKAHYLNRRQAIFITAKSDTAAATDITIEIIRRFDAYERGEMAAPVRFDKGVLRAINRRAHDLAVAMEAEYRRRLTTTVAAALARGEMVDIGSLSGNGLPPSRADRLQAGGAQ